MPFLVDEDLPRSLVRELKGAGLIAHHVVDLGLRGQSDDEILTLAQSKNLALLTGDVGFGNILRFPLGSHPGIIIVRFPNEVPPDLMNAVIVRALLDLAILEMRAARGWSLPQTGRHFLITTATVASWMHRLDEEGADALVRMPAPVNKFPEFVTYLVRRLKVLCPTMGKTRIANVLCRAGLHLGSTTVRRMLRDTRRRKPTKSGAGGRSAGRIVTARRPNHVWFCDLTTIPYFSRKPACRAPRFEPRERWPRRAPCARPRALIRGRPGIAVELAVSYQAGREHLL